MLESIDGYPEKAKSIILRLVGYKQLQSYLYMNGILVAFGRIDRRLSNRALSKDNCERYIPLIAEHKAELEEMFLAFFPNLCRQYSRAVIEKM